MLIASRARSPGILVRVPRLRKDLPPPFFFEPNPLTDAVYGSDEYDETEGP
jgi:hypothetical protein